MKNLTRVLALVIVLAMMMSTVAFASFTDVAADDDYAEAIETLAALGIIKGYTDGTFGADKAITRAEAVAIVNRIQNLSLAASGAAGASLYTDVAADHWALGDINLATQMGVISGDGNGLFRPEDQVSYQEMVKMLTTALGYGPAVAENGGWPTGYLVVAQSKGILDDTVNGGATAANRGVVAQLTFNALTAPLMEQTGYGDEKEYHFMEAGTTQSPNYTKTLLDQKLSIYKAAVEAKASDFSTLDNVTYPINEAGKVTVYVDEYFDVKLPTDLSTGNQTWLKGDSDLGDQLAYKAVAYVKKNADKKYEVLYSAVDKVENKAVVVPANQITVTGNTIVVEDDNNVKEKYYFDSTNTNTDVVRNGAHLVYGNTLATSHFTQDGTNALDTDVTLLYTDNQDDVVDYIFIKKYTTDIVNQVSDKAVIGKRSYIKLDKEAEKNLVYTLTLDGEEVTPAELQKGDVFSYIATNGTLAYEIVATRNSVEGTVEAFSDDTNDAKKEWTIGGTVYTQSMSAGATYTKMNSVEPGFSGTFYLDPFGKIAYFEKSASTGAVASANLAVVKDFGMAGSGMGAKVAVELLKADGTVEQITLANKVTINRVQKSMSGDVTSATETAGLVVMGTGTGYGANEIADQLDTILVDGALIDYTLNTSGLLSSITYAYADTVDHDGDLGANTPEIPDTVYDTTDPLNPVALYQSVAGAKDDVYFTKYTESAVSGGSFIEKTSRLDGLNITDDTIVFYVPTADTSKDSWSVADKAFFEDGVSSYQYTAYCVNTDKGIGAVVIESTHQTGIIKDAAAVFASSATVKNEDGIRVTQITFYQNGELKTLNTDAEYSNADLKIGVPFVFKYKATGEIDNTSIKPLKNTADPNHPTFAGYAEPADTGAACYYAYGQLVERDGNSIKLGSFLDPEYDADFDWEPHKIPETANVYIVDFSGKKDTIAAASMNEIFANQYFVTPCVRSYGPDGIANNGDDIVQSEITRLVYTDAADNYTVLIKFNKDMDITDVIAYKNNSTKVVEKFVDAVGTEFTIDYADITPAKNYFGSISF